MSYFAMSYLPTKLHKGRYLDLIFKCLEKVPEIFWEKMVVVTFMAMNRMGSQSFMAGQRTPP